MARPRIFLSSTYYDLKYIRASLELFIGSLGFDAVLSEKGDIAYVPDSPLDESCYQEVKNCDIYVLLVGGRYGSAASDSEPPRPEMPKSFYDRYESITKLEYKAAVSSDIPVYILVEKAVHAEYQTYTRNRSRSDIDYAHVDSVNVFRFIEEVLAQRRNNPMQPFDKPAEIEEWLREQWAGLFRELLHRKVAQQQFTSLSTQVQALSQVNSTLRRYLEEVIEKVSEPKDAERLISSESARLNEAERIAELGENALIRHLRNTSDNSLEEIAHALKESPNLRAFLGMLRVEKEAQHQLVDHRRVQDDANSARNLFGLSEWPADDEVSDKVAGPSKRGLANPSKVMKS